MHKILERALLILFSLAVSHIAGREAKTRGYTNVYAPIPDVARDQRCGRVLECYG